MSGMEEDVPYRLIQLGRHGNIEVDGLESLVTHHPIANRNARVVDGVIRAGEKDRTHALVGGEIQEIRIVSERAASGEQTDRVLMKKDFILEDSRVPVGGAGARRVDVPSPFAGYIGSAGGSMGTVDIYDRQGGTLVARVLHLDPIHVREGATIEYGQALGVQSNRGLPKAGKHVHMEVDTAYYQHYENYLADLVDGRLGMDSSWRAAGMEPRAVVDDGVIRIGEASDRVRDVQRHLNAEGYRGADNRPLAEDGVYRVAMQAAVIRFQEARGLSVTGDLDATTLQTIPRPQRREADRPDHHGPGQPLLGAPTPPAAPAPPRPGLEGEPLHTQARVAVEVLDRSLGRNPDDASERMAASLATLARENGIGRIDHVVLSEQTPTVRQGENVFVVQGALNDPGHRIAWMKTQDAVSAPIEQSTARFNESSIALNQQQQTEIAHTHHQPSPRMVVA